MRERGFTAIELLIAVAIVGLLAAIAIPSYGMMVARSKQAEAKGNLASIHGLEIAFHGEHQRFGSFTAIGFVPDGLNRYGYRIRRGEEEPPETGPMGSGAGDDLEEILPNFLAEGVGSGVGQVPVSDPEKVAFASSSFGNPHYDADSFEVVAIGRISEKLDGDGNLVLDAWAVDERKTVVHLKSGY